MSDDTTNGIDRTVAAVRDRRSVLRGAAVAGLAGISVPVLAACGDDGTAGSTPSGSPSSQATGSSSAAPSATPTASPTGGGTGPVLGAAADVPVGGGAVFKDAKVVVTQPTAGRYQGFTAVCTHSGCLVSKVENDTIDCNCHGSKFSATDGSVVNGPAREPLAAVAVSVQGGNLVGPPA